MRYRGNKVTTQWGPGLAYAVGLITSDGNLSPDGRHIALTSKDREMVENFYHALGISGSIGMKSRGGESEKKYFVAQFSDVRFYEFLVSIGLTPAKSKTLGALTIPQHLFCDFFRGCIDGDGNIQSFSHPQSRHPQVRLSLCSASKGFLEWIHEQLKIHYGVSGGSFYTYTTKALTTLSYGKEDSRILVANMYYSPSVLSLSRKRYIAESLLIESNTGTS